MTNSNNKMNNKSVWLRSSTPRRLPVTPLCLSCLVAAASTRRAESAPQNPPPTALCFPVSSPSLPPPPPYGNLYFVSLSMNISPTSHPSGSFMSSLLHEICLVFLWHSSSRSPGDAAERGDSLSFSESDPRRRRLLETCVLCFQPAAKVQKADGSATPSAHVFLSDSGRCQL